MHALTSLREAFHAAFHQPGTRINRVVETVVWTLIIVSIVLLATEPFLDPKGETLAIIKKIDKVLLWIFAFEVCARIASYRPPALAVFERPPLGRLRTHFLARFRFATSPFILIDILTVLALVPALRGLRVLRLLRLLRSIRIFRYANPFEGIFHAFEQNRVLFWFAFSVLGVEAILGGTTFYLVEKAANPGIGNLGDGIWWAIVTSTTVGYGDITPVTAVGRMIGAVMMVGGMFMLALFAGIVGHSLLNAVLSIREEQFRMGDYVDHIIVCGYEHGGGLLLDTLRAQLGHQDRRIVLFGESERPQDVPPDYLWVRGDPTKESELAKARITHCSTVIVVGLQSEQPQHADAKTVLTIFTIRSYLRKHPTTQKRLEPVYIVVEVLDSENVDHARAAGADEVIETRRVGFSLLAHTVAYPGTANAASRVVFANDQNLYVGDVPDGLSAPVNFDDVSALIRTKHNAIVIGVIDPNTGEEFINPSSDRSIGAHERLLYIAEKPRF